MKRNRFTIITVCYNAQNCIGETIKSVLNQSYKEFEYIIQDGNSDDNTFHIVTDLTQGDKRVIIVQEKDEGIYDAMNRALASAQGEYVLFMNAGDTFANKDVLYNADKYISEYCADIFYGDIIEVTGGRDRIRTYKQKNSRLWYYSLGACLCHQAMFCNRKLFEERLFDLKYKVCADREWQMYHIKHGKKTKAMGIPIAKVLVDGFSSQHVDELEKETKGCIMLYCGKWSVLYKLIVQFKRNRLVHGLLSFGDRLVSTRFHNI